MKLKNILFVAAAAGLAVLASCGGDSKSSPKPTVTFQSGASYTSANIDAYFDTTLTIGIRTFSNDNSLTGVKVTLSTNGATAGTIWDTVFSSKTLNYDFKYKVVGSVGDVQTLTVISTDKNGQTASAGIVISIVPTTVAIVTQSGQQCWNVQGLNEGAYDLYSAVTVPKAGLEASKDLKDLTPSTAVFSKSWGSGNGAKFVRVSSNDWANATSSDYLWNLWKNNGASATTSITAITTGDVILVKTGQAIPFNIYILHVTQVYDDGTATNNDFVKFDYKGLTK